MRTFNNFIEGIIDPKRNPKANSFEKSDSEDDSYISPSEEDDDDSPNYRNKLGLTAQYPLAKASGKMRGMQTKTSDELFRKGSAFKDKLGQRDLVDTLRSKLYAGEPMTKKEMDYLGKMLDKEYEMFTAQYNAIKKS